MLSFSKWKEENGKYEEIQRKTEVKSVHGCSDDSDAFKGNTATADGIKNMVNFPRKSQYNRETIQTQFKIAGKFKRLMKKYFQQKTR